jgi:hypothetical protein
MGNMIFSLLTGLWPYYHLPYALRPDLQKLTVAGIVPYLNPVFRTRSLIERRLVELMELCYKRKPSDRISIFEVVRHLHETEALHEQEEERKQGI